jgi:hypothetical protein
VLFWRKPSSFSTDVENLVRVEAAVDLTEALVRVPVALRLLKVGAAGKGSIASGSDTGARAVEPVGDSGRSTQSLEF